MNVFAIADLHLNLSVPEKSMEVFGPSWKNYVARIETNWKSSIQENDLVLLAGDLCWAGSLEEAKTELDWVDQLPGTKVLIKGNHDYWWSSLKKVRSCLPPSIHVIQNDAFHIDDIAIGGTRLWDTKEYNFSKYIPFVAPTKELETEIHKDLSEKIYERELNRLKMSLSQINPSAKIKIAMVHYPPISAELAPSRASKILEDFKTDICVFGHLHNVDKKASIFGIKDKVRYLLTSADYLDCIPLKVL